MVWEVWGSGFHGFQILDSRVFGVVSSCSWHVLPPSLAHCRPWLRPLIYASLLFQGREGRAGQGP